MDEEEVKAKHKKVHWVPLESNPDMLTQFASKGGLPEGWQFVDIFGTDDELLAMVPQPVLAVTLLFECSQNIKAFKEKQREEINASGQTISDDLIYMKQYVGNACGTIATIHSVLNNAELVGLAEDTPLGKFLSTIKEKTPEEAGNMLADAADLHEASQESAQGGQTAAPEATANVDHHFIAFVEKGGDVYELDGAKAFPVNHGKSEGDLLKKAISVVKTNFMNVDPDSVQFNMMALAKA